MTSVVGVRRTYDGAMTDLLVEMNHAHIDEVEMASILNDFRELGLQGDATEQSTLLKATWWVLVLHWVGSDVPHLAFDSILTVVAQRSWWRFRSRGEDGPKRIDVIDASDQVIISIEIEIIDSLG